jgi:type IV pilus assembly protein PilM
MAQNILGIDIGTYSVKLILLERSFDDFKILQFAEQPLNLQTRLPHDELVALAVEQALKATPMTADIVSVSLPGHLVSSRAIDMPFTNVKKLAQVVEFELEGFVPFAIEDLVFDFHVLSKTENVSRLLCVYMHQERFAKYLDSLSGAGIDPKYFGADVVDLANIAQVTMVPRGLYALCDIGHSKTNVCIMKGRDLQYARTIGIGGLHFTRALQRAFNVNYEKAESLKVARGRVCVREQDSDQVSRILNHVATELVSGIKQTFLGYENIAGRQPVAAIYCTGGSSRLSGLIDHLSFHLRTNVLELDSLHAIQHGLEDTSEANRVMTQVICNAIRPIFSNRLPKINFRKGPYAYKQDIQVLTHELKPVAILAGVILLLGAGYYFYAGYHFAKKKEAIDAKIERIVKSEYADLAVKKGRSGGGALNAYLKQAQSKYNELKTQASSVLGEGGPSVLDVMQEISARLPAKKEFKFSINDFNYQDDFVRVNASTDDPLNATKIAEVLKESDLFPNVEATDPQSKPNNQWDFQMKIDLKKPEGATAAKPGTKGK